MAQPSDITLTGDIVYEATPNGSTIGIFTIVDPDPLGDNTLILLDDANGAFRLDDGDLLVVADSNKLDFDINPTLDISVIAGRCTADSLIKSFTITVLDDDTLAPIITKVNKVASKGQALICVEGRFFTDGGSTTLYINGEEYPYIENTLEAPDNLTDTKLCFNLLGTSLVGPSIPDCEETSPFGCGIFPLTICNGNTDIGGNPLCDSDLFIRYKSDQSPSPALGNTACITKASIGVNIDGDTPISGFNSLNINWEPNANTSYVQVRTKYDFRYDVTTGGTTALDGVTLIDGDLVWLTNQGTDIENGIWVVREGSWDYDMVVDSNVFVDLGASAFDPDIGNVTRDIITVVHPGGTLDDTKHMMVDWGTVGIYNIDYYYLTQACVLSKTSRRVRVFKPSASISPVNTFAITDYRIFNGVDKDLMDNIIPGGSDDVCCPGFEIPQSTIYIKKDGTTAFLAEQSMSDNRLTNVAYGLNDGDAVSLQQLTDEISLIPYISNVFTAGEDINIYDAVRIDIDGLLYKVDATDITTVNTLVGISIMTGVIGDEITVVTKGTIEASDGISPTINNFSTLVQGHAYWVGIDGAISLNPPSTGFSQVIGVATSCTTFVVNHQMLIVL